MPTNAIEARGVLKRYKGKNGEVLALSDLNLTVPRGSIFALLGPNGAGKSTFINILAGLTRKSGGSISVWGIDLDKDRRNAKSHIGVVPQELVMDPYFTPIRLLDLQGGLFGLRRRREMSEQLLKAMSLEPQSHSYARSLSGGMKRRLMIAKAFAHAPPILVLDEPTAGVDVELRLQLWELIRKLAKLDTTILLTTHYIYEAEKLCDRVAIIDRGKVIAHDTTKALLGKISDKEVTLTLKPDSPPIPRAALESFDGVKLGKNQFKLRYKQGEFTRISELIASGRLLVKDLSTEGADLERVFLELTKKS